MQEALEKLRGNEEELNNEESDESFGMTEDKEGLEKNLSKDGGLVKKILRVGEGYDKPDKGDKVTVHYKGTLEDGKEFDSSYTRNEPFTFTLGQGSVIKGWDQGVQTMKKGEVSILKCRADYAYGEQGSPPTIPPNATLNFEVHLLSWVSIKDISGDGGVVKNILKESESYETPDKKDYVIINCKISQIQDQNKKVLAELQNQEYDLSKKPLCKGFQVGIKSMKLGEKALFQISSTYAQGISGLDNSAKAEMEIELVQIQKVVNVTDDGQVVKRTLKDTKEWNKAKEGAQATINLQILDTHGHLLDEKLQYTYTTDNEEIVDAIDQAVLSMKVGEVALVTCEAQYGFQELVEGSRGKIQPHTPFIAQIELLKAEKIKESWEMDSAEKIEACQARREKGNSYFKQNKFVRAIKLYNRAVMFVEHLENFEDNDIKKQAQEIQKLCRLNLAAAYIKQNDFSEALKECNKVLEMDPTNVKALFRRSQIYIGTSDYIEATQDIKQAMQLEPKNKDLKVQSQKIKQAEKIQNQKDGQVYGKMFQGTAHKITSPLRDSNQQDAKTVG